MPEKVLLGSVKSKKNIHFEQQVVEKNYGKFLI